MTFDIIGAANPFLTGAGGLVAGFTVLTGLYLLKPRKRRLEAETSSLEVKRLIAMYEAVAKERDHWQELAIAYQVKCENLVEGK